MRFPLLNLNPELLSQDGLLVTQFGILLPQKPVATRSPVSVFHGEPIGELFAFAETRVSVIVDVTNLVNKHIVQIEVTNGGLRPDQPPQAALLNPATAIHFRFDPLSWFWRSNIQFNERLLDRVKIDCRSPLQAVTGKQPTFLCHATELDDIQFFLILSGQLQNSFTDVIGRNRVDISGPGWLSDDFQFVLVMLTIVCRIVPDFRSIKGATMSQSVAPMLVRRRRPDTVAEGRNTSMPRGSEI